MVRTTLGAEVETEVTIAGSESVEFINADTSGSIPDGDVVSRFVRPPPGFVYELINLRFKVASPGGNSSDFHDVIFRSESERIGILSGRSSGDKRLQVRKSNFVSADESQSPKTETAQITALKGSRLSPTAGLELVYRNFSGSSVTDGILYRLWVRQIEVGDT